MYKAIANRNGKVYQEVCYNFVMASMFVESLLPSQNEKSFLNPVTVTATIEDIRNHLVVAEYRDQWVYN